MESWYAVHVRFQAERLVANRLIDLGLDSFFPSTIETRRWSDRKKEIERALFPGYLFGRFDGESREQLHQVLVVSGVIRVLGVGLRSIAIPDQDVADIREMLTAGTNLTVTPLQFHPGDKVTVMRGSFRNIEGRVTAIKRRGNRLVVAIPMLNRVVSAEMDTDAVRAA